MKSFFTLILAVFLSGSLFAQGLKNIVSNSTIGLAPLGIFTKIRGKLEYLPPEKKFTIGGVGSLHYPLVVGEGYFAFNTFGLMAEPFIRLYGQDGADKFYFQAKAIIGYMHYKYIEGDYYITTYEEGNFIPKGLGAGLGYQTWFGAKKNWYVDFTLNLRFTSASKNVIVDYGWYVTGAGSIFNPNLLIGFKL